MNILLSGMCDESSPRDRPYVQLMHDYDTFIVYQPRFKFFHINLLGRASHEYFQCISQHSYRCSQAQELQEIVKHVETTNC